MSPCGVASLEEKLIAAVDDGAWEEVRCLLGHLGTRSWSRMRAPIWELVLDILFWCHAWAFPEKRLLDDGLVPQQKMRKVFSVLPAYLESKTYPLIRVLALAAPLPVPFREPQVRALWRRHLRHLRQRLRAHDRAVQRSQRRDAAGTKTPSHMTLRDLASLWRSDWQRKRVRFSRSRFLRIGRRIVAPGHNGPRRRRQITGFLREREIEKAAFHRVPVRGALRATWGGLGSHGSRFLERLVEATAVELRHVRRLALEVSRARRHVVLSLHNASAAACSGWAFEPVDVLTSASHYGHAFVEEVAREGARRAAVERHAEPRDLVKQLWIVWQRRLVHPKALHALWEAWARRALGCEHVFKDAFRAVSDLLDGDLPQDFPEESPLAWSGWLSLHQQFHWQNICRWRREKQRLWSKGFAFLRACVERGQAWLKDGRLEACVVPWIDKFFISSRREKDWTYLALLMEWIQREHLSPIVLLWEDTTRGCEPSLALALRKYWKPGTYQGFGIFGHDSWTRSNAEGVLTREAEPNRLYVLRPLDDTHAPQPLEAVLTGGVSPQSFFSLYDTSWKDGAYAFYTGTQVAPLTSIATEVDVVPAWVVFEGVQRPLGWFFRRVLRDRVLQGGSGALFRHAGVRLYARFANLL
ncbi:hypothetical protein [Desulfosoma caldarium]|uniref:Uncharacterized protein n=1 Tax=Desulfosoma caldarium TaxID=610254 RepID=A0A3N1VIT6_9BACT|nr:hypothetical protein [Desulfosoma caldarium]ROR01830.1 hypothetical protein EDC27_1022 [Desulfosoma caldarium]